MEPTISPFKEEDDDSQERQEKEINEFLSEVEKSEVEKMIDIKFSKIFNQFEVFTVFTLLVFTSMSCNMDNGILSGAAENIKQDLSIENLQFGMLGTIIFLGLSIGSLLGMKIF